MLSRLTFFKITIFNLPTGKYQKMRAFPMFSGLQKGNIDLKWVDLLIYL